MHKTVTRWTIGLCFFVAVSPAFGQGTGAFERLSVGVSGSYSLVENNFTRSWNPAPGLQISLQTPFYAGSLEGGVRYTRFNYSGDLADVSDFNAFFIYLGWEYLFEITPGFRAGPVVRFGNTFLQFDDIKAYPSPDGSWEYHFDSSESEFAYGFAFRNEIALSENWSVRAEFAYNRTLTFHPLPVTFLTVGIKRSFKSPIWLKKLLK